VQELKPSRLFAAGAGVWAVAVAITVLTGDRILVPTVILVGSFIVPVTLVTFALSRLDAAARPSADVLVLAFFGAGTLGVLSTALTETYLLPSVYGTFLGVGLIEEVGKGAVLVAVARRAPVRGVRAGIVLGATVGAGFAAFESSGYAFSALAEHADDHPALNVVETELFRAALAPCGHITWTALLGGALLARRSVGITLAGVVVLHALWDASYGWAITLTKGLTGDGWHAAWPSTAAWVGDPTGSKLVVFQVVYDGLLVVIGLTGALWLLHRWRASPPEAPAAGLRPPRESRSPA
jgi:RsiW-degrading membrane proteinase PrsW (M82 family)